MGLVRPWAEWRAGWRRFRRNPFLWLAALAGVAVLMLASNPLRSQAVQSLRGMVPFGPNVRISRIIPLKPTGVVPIGFAGASLLWFTILGASWLARVAHRAGWRVWCFGAATLAAWLALGAVGWVTALQLLLDRRWGHDGLQILTLVGFILAYVVGAFLALRWWRRDLERRCPVCLRLCGLAEERGNAHDVLVAPLEVETVCLLGHGLNVESRWGRSFGGDGVPSPLG